MKWGWVAILLCLFGGARVRGADAAEAVPPPPALRYLFLYDTSYSMSRAAPAARQALADLIYSGIQDQMRPGDLFTVWPFHAQVMTNRFGRMTWQPGAHQALADSTLALLKVLRNEKSSRLDLVWQEVAKVARTADMLTVLVLTDGDDPFRGTPFDSFLNQAIKDHAREQRRARKPFLAALTAVRGQFVACTIGSAGSPIDFQSLARQLERVVPPPPAAPLVTNVVATNVVYVTNWVSAPAASPAAPARTEATPPPADTLPAGERQGVFASPPAIAVSSNPVPAALAGVDTPAPQASGTNPVALPPPAAALLATNAAPESASSPPSESVAPVEPPPRDTTPPSAAALPGSARLPALGQPSTGELAQAGVAAKPRVEPTSPAPAVAPPPDAGPAKHTETGAVASVPPSRVVTPPVRRTNVEVAGAGGDVSARAPSGTRSEAVKPLVPGAWRPRIMFALYALGSVAAGLLVFGVIYRAARRRPQPSLISRSIEKQIH